MWKPSIKKKKKKKKNQPENEEINPEEEVDADEKGPYILLSEVKKLSRR